MLFKFDYKFMFDDMQNYQSYEFDIKQWFLITTKEKKSFNDILCPLWSTPTIWHRGELIIKKQNILNVNNEIKKKMEL